MLLVFLFVKLVMIQLIMFAVSEVDTSPSWWKFHRPTLRPVRGCVLDFHVSTPTTVPYPLRPARSILWRRSPTSVSGHLPYCMEHLYPDTYFVPRIALTKSPSASRTPPSLCPGSELICTAVLILVLTHQFLISVQHQAVTLPQLSQSVGKQ